MDHPLRSKDNKELRGRVVQFLKDGYTIQRQSNIVFVCGGNEPDQMRTQFRSKFAELLPEHEFFEPEFAMKNYFSLGDGVPFDISEFEEIVGELSHSIVIFPEAPGSFAETGYFSARPQLARKIILAIDVTKQKKDSFISLGPAKKINDTSIFAANIQLDYRKPNFSIISERILERAPLHKNRRTFSIAPFAKTTPFELFALIHQIVSLLKIATIEDIEFFMRSLFSSQISLSKTKKITSMLVGSKRLKGVGDFGHLAEDETRPSFLTIRDGARTRHDVLNIDLSAMFLTADPDVKKILEL